ncbi:hypothetical protein LTR94_037140, partial [Friedmanniomyces endolithicus]
SIRVIAASTKPCSASRPCASRAPTRGCRPRRCCCASTPPSAPNRWRNGAACRTGRWASARCFRGSSRRAKRPASSTACASWA